MADEPADVMAEPVGEANGFSLVLPAQADSVGALRSQVTDFARRAGADEAVAYDAALAVSEAATNAVLHAYESSGDGAGGVVELRGKLDDGWLEFQVLDHGGGFRSSPSGGLGLGLKVMAEVSDAMTVLQRDEGTTVVLRFTLVRDDE